MKTIIEHLNELPEPYKYRALENTPVSNLTIQTSSLYNALNHAFTWDKSKEGFAYWDCLTYLILFEENKHES